MLNLAASLFVTVSAHFGIFTSHIFEAITKANMLLTIPFIFIIAVLVREYRSVVSGSSSLLSGGGLVSIKELLALIRWCPISLLVIFIGTIAISAYLLGVTEDIYLDDDFSFTPYDAMTRSGFVVIFFSIIIPVLVSAYKMPGSFLKNYNKT